jgi:lipid-A-disaccharide synthase-like uncharacterized protein
MMLKPITKCTTQNLPKDLIMKFIKQFAMWVLQGLIGLVFVIGGALFLIEYMAGCGENYIDSKGISHPHQCFFINR